MPIFISHNHLWLKIKAVGKTRHCYTFLPTVLSFDGKPRLAVYSFGPPVLAMYPQKKILPITPHENVIILAKVKVYVKRKNAYFPRTKKQYFRINIDKFLRCDMI